MKFVSTAVLVLLVGATQTFSTVASAYAFGGCMVQATEAAKSHAVTMEKESVEGNPATCKTGEPKVTGPLTVNVPVTCDKFQGTFEITTGLFSSGCMEEPSVQLMPRMGVLPTCKFCAVE